MPAVLDRGSSRSSETSDSRQSLTKKPVKSRSKKPSAWVRPKWLEAAQLQQARAEVHLKGEVLEDPAQLKSLARKLCGTEIDFISSPEFCQADSGSLIFSGPEILWDSTSRNRTGKDGDYSVMLSQICHARLLKPDEERALFGRMNFLLSQANAFRSKIDPESPDLQLLHFVQELLALAHWFKERLIEANIRLVVSIAKKFTNDHSAFEDMVSDGICSLIRAVEKFDYGLGFRFSTYATQVIRRDLYRLMMSRKKDAERFATGSLESEPEMLEDESAAITRERRWEILRDRLNELMAKLDRREQLIIRSRFALGAHRKVHALQSVANRLGISKERVRQLEKRALEKLQEMSAQFGPLEIEAI